MIALLLSNKLATGIGAFAILLCFWLGIVKIENIHLQSEVVRDQILIATLTEQNTQFAADVAAQNAAIKKAQDVAMLREKAASDAIAKATKDSTHQKAAARITATPSTGDDCQDAKHLFNGYIAGVK